MRLQAARRRVLHPGIDLVPRLTLGKAVTRLQAADQFVPPAADVCEIFIGELDPILPDLALNCIQSP